MIFDKAADSKASKNPWHCHPERGFTIIEFLMVAVIVAIISVVIAKILFQGYQSFITANNIFQADWQGWIAIQRIGEDIHRLYSSSAISTASTSQLIFTDVDGNSIQYQLSGANLLRNGQVLTSGIQSLNFAYLDQNGLSTSNLSSIRFISISITASSDNLSSSFTTLMGTRAL